MNCPPLSLHAGDGGILLLRILLLLRKKPPGILSTTVDKIPGGHYFPLRIEPSGFTGSHTAGDFVGRDFTAVRYSVQQHYSALAKLRISAIFASELFSLPAAVMIPASSIPVNARIDLYVAIAPS